MENRINYIKAGCGLASKKFFVAGSLSLFIWVCIGRLFGRMALFYIMLLLAVSVTAFILVLVFQKPSTKNDLMMRMALFGGWTFEFLLIECNTAIDVFGVAPYLLFIVVQPLILPSILVYIKERSFKTEKQRSKKGAIVAGGSVLGAGTVGMIFGEKVFQKLDAKTQDLSILFIMAILVVGFSAGLISIHQLYHLKKYEKEYGPFPD